MKKAKKSKAEKPKLVPAAATQEHVQWLARRLYDITAAQQWIEWRAPLALIADADDTFLVAGNARRPLRINDVVTFNGTSVLVRSVNPDWTHDSMQMAEYEGLVLA